MGTDLGKRVRNECASVYLGGKAESQGVRSTYPSLVNPCAPNVVIPKLSLTYLSLPKKLKQAITDPDKAGRDLMKRDKLIFFHYKLDMKKYEKEAEEYSKIDMNSREFGQIFGEGDQQNSCLYTNFLGETNYVGNRDLMQQMTDYLKGGFENVLEITSQLVGEDLAKTELELFNELQIFDAVGKPKYVCLPKK